MARAMDNRNGQSDLRSPGVRGRRPETRARPCRRPHSDAGTSSTAIYRCNRFVYDNADVALNIDDPEAERLVRELAARTGETLTEAVVVALRERLVRDTGCDRAAPLREELAAIRRRCASLPVVERRSAEEILGYDKHGISP